MEHHLDSVEHRLVSMEHRLASTEHRLDSAEHRLVSMEHRLDSAEHRLDSNVMYGESTVPTRPKSSIPNQLNAAQLAINNTLNDPEIQTLVGTYGYSAAKMQEGQQLHAAATAATNAYAAAMGRQRRATARMQAAKSMAYASYQDLAKVARMLFSPASGQLTSLGLNHAMPHNKAAFLSAATILFSNARTQAEIAAALACYGYDMARLESEWATIVAFQEALLAQGTAIAEKRRATRERRAALAALNGWLAHYRTVAGVALRSKPELLSTLGGTAQKAEAASTGKEAG